MRKSEMEEVFKKLLESCPHDTPAPGCPFKIYRNNTDKMPENLVQLYSVDNKYLMLRYHKICNGLRTKEK